MRESIGGTWFFQLIIVFILLFVAYLALSINYSKSFKVKNEIISFLEREEGLTNRTSPDKGALQLINDFLVNSGYSATGECDAGWVGVSSLEIGSSPEIVSNENNNLNKKFYYCVEKVIRDDNVGNYGRKTYYRVRTFFKFDLPVVGKFMVFKVDGVSDDVDYPCDKSVFGK